MFAQIAPKKSLMVLTFGAVVSYSIMMMCGRMGSPNPVNHNTVNCGIHNNCTISENLFQVCEQNSHKSPSTDKLYS